MSMVRAELKGVMVPDFPTDDHPFEPATPTDFGIDVVAYIGAAGSNDADEFAFVWCTPSWLSRSVRASKSPRLIRAHMLTAEWKPDGLKEVGNVIRERCTSTVGPDWDTVASRLSRWLDWELAYRYDGAIDHRGGD